MRAHGTDAVKRGTGSAGRTADPHARAAARPRRAGAAR